MPRRRSKLRDRYTRAWPAPGPGRKLLTLESLHRSLLAEAATQTILSNAGKPIAERLIDRILEEGPQSEEGRALAHLYLGLSGFAVRIVEPDRRSSRDFPAWCFHGLLQHARGEWWTDEAALKKISFVHPRLWFNVLAASEAYKDASSEE